MNALSVTSCGRFLTRDGKRPFLLLADTAWELAHRLNLEEVERYAATRSSQGFNAVLFCLLAEMDGLRVPNRYGEVPFENEDPQRPNEGYFRYVDLILDVFAKHGLIAGILPTWGDKWNRVAGAGPEVFDVANARAYGTWLGRRYSGRDLFWVLGGDRKVESDRHRDVLGAMADGLCGSGLITFHPAGQVDGRNDLRDPGWLDFSMLQTGHCHPCVPGFQYIEREYTKTVAKPVLDGEPCYEGHPVMTPQWEPQEERHGAYACRRALYWAVFSGACGHVYGAHPVWQFHIPERRPEINRATWRWEEALQFPGARQMGLIHRLLPFPGDGLWFPAQELIGQQPAAECAHLVACRDASRHRALVYAPFGDGLHLDLSSLNGSKISFRWIHPATGETCGGGMFLSPKESIPCPRGSPDWILSLEAS